MSQQEKENLISLVTTLVVSIPYFIYVISNYNTQLPTGENELRFWANAILLLIPIRIASEIIFHIIAAIFVTAITGKDETGMTDERDKLISLKSERFSHYVFLCGFMAAILSVAATASVTTMFMIFLVSGFLTELTNILLQVYYYRKETVLELLTQAHNNQTK